MASKVQQCWWLASSLCLGLAGALIAAVKALLGLSRPAGKHFIVDAAFTAFVKWTDYKQQRYFQGVLGALGVGQVKQQGTCTVRQELDGVTFTAARHSHTKDVPDVILLYIHGGGMVVGNPIACAPIMAQIITRLEAEHRLRCEVVSLDYDLAPERPFPHGLAQVVTKVHSLLKTWHGAPSTTATGTKPCPPAIVMMGDSAGGNLVLAALLALHQHCPVPALSHSLPPIAGALLLSPWTDLTAGSAVRLPSGPPCRSVLQRLTGVRSRGSNSSSSSSAHLQHVYPCTKQSQPAATCDCVAQHRLRLESDFVTGPFLTSCADKYVAGTLGKRAATNRLAAESPSGPSTAHDVLLQQVEGCVTMEALTAHPLVSPSLADPAVLSAALRSLLHSPALVFGGELEVMLPDILKLVDGVNEAAASGRKREAGGEKLAAAVEVGLGAAAGAELGSIAKGTTVSSVRNGASPGDLAAAVGDSGSGCQLATTSREVETGGLQYEAWRRDVHVAGLLPRRDELVPRFWQYVADVTKAWQQAQK